MSLKTWLLSLCMLCMPLFLHAKKDFTVLGDTLQIALPAAGFSYSLYSKDKHGAYQLTKSLVANQFVVESLKHSIRSERPNGKKYSFPSGHTAASFVGASFLHKRYGFHYAWPAYGLACLVGASRLDAKAHWPVDVAFGALIGYGITHFFTTPHEKATLKLAWLSHGPGWSLEFNF